MAPAGLSHSSKVQHHTPSEASPGPFSSWPTPGPPPFLCLVLGSLNSSCLLHQTGRGVAPVCREGGKWSAAIMCSLQGKASFMLEFHPGSAHAAPPCPPGHWSLGFSSPMSAASPPPALFPPLIPISTGLGCALLSKPPPSHFCQHRLFLLFQAQNFKESS